jgi:hypothetical protein
MNNEEPEVEVEIITSEEASLEEELDRAEKIDSSDFENATGIHVMTITYNDGDGDAPVVNLGGTSPWLAYSILSAALDTLSMIRSPLSINHNGHTLFSPDMFDE